MKKVTSVILALVIAFSCFACVASVTSNAAVQQLWIWFGSEDVENLQSTKAVSWWQADNGEYYLFVPSYWDASALKIFTSVTGDVKMGDTVITSGETYDLGQSGTLTYNGTDYKYNVVASSGVGSVFIETESGSLDAINADKEYSESGTVYMYDADGESQLVKKKTEYNGLDSIKGRGNQTWEYDKKPYNIKIEKKLGIFGMKESKKWCLIANYDDNTIMRNAIAYDAATNAGLKYSPESAPVDLYINGDYMGAYLITSKIEADENRIDVEDLDDVNEEICIEQNGEDFDMDTLTRGGVYGKYSGLLEGTYKYVDIPETEASTTTGGYILEMELANRYADEVSGFVTTNSQPVIMKSPEYASKAQMEFISDYYQRFEDAAYSETGKNSNGEAYTDLADLESLAKYYTYSEWLSNMDSGLTSSYFYLDSSKDGILYAGPVWDYDIALGNNSESRYGCDYTDPEQFTVAFGRMYRNTVFGSWDANDTPTIYNVLAQKQDFQDACRKYWDSDIFSAVTAWGGEKFDNYAAKVKDSTVMDHIRWNTYGTYDVNEISKDIDADVASLKDFITKRTAFINTNIGTVQENPHQTNFFMRIIKGILTSVNNIFEKAIVAFHLENK